MKTLKLLRLIEIVSIWEQILYKFLCIQYLITFWKKFVFALFNSDNKINTIQPVFAKKLGLFIRLTDVKVLKINGITLNIYKIVVVAFLVTNKANQIRFFKKTFLFANDSLEIVLEILFFTLSDADIDFLGQEL